MIPVLVHILFVYSERFAPKTMIQSKCNENELNFNWIFLEDSKKKQKIDLVYPAIKFGYLNFSHQIT